MMIQTSGNMWLQTGAVLCDCGLSNYAELLLVGRCATRAASTNHLLNAKHDLVMQCTTTNINRLDVRR